MKSLNLKYSILCVFLILPFIGFAQSDSARNSIIIEPLSPVSKNFTFGYRRAFEKIKLKGEVGLIGISKGDALRGQFFKLSVEFENVFFADTKNNFMFVQLVPANFHYQSRREWVTSLALIFGIGERIKTGRLFFEYFSGIGMAASTNKKRAYNYGFLKLNGDFPLVVSFGFSMGYKF